LKKLAQMADSDLALGPTFSKTIRVWDRGLTLKAIEELVPEFEKLCDEQPGDKDTPGARTPGERLVSRVVKPRTKDNKTSFVTLIASDPATSGEVGQANIFISHSWKYDFKKLVGAIRDYEQKTDGKTNHYFLDYLAVNQWSPMSDLGQLQKTIEQADTTLLVLSPWNAPIPMQRCWCLFEIMKTLGCDTELVIAMPPQEHHEFIKSVKMGMVDSIITALSKIDSANSEASVKSDQDMIHAEMREMGGFNKVNRACLTALRNWVHGEVDDFLKEIEEEKVPDSDKERHNHECRLAFVELSNAMIAHAHGNVDKAQKNYERALPIIEKLYGPTNIGTLSLMVKLAAIHSSQNQPEKAEKELRRIRKVLGEEYTGETVETYSQCIYVLALTLLEQEKNLDECEKLLRPNIETRIKAFGEDSDNTLHSKGLLAACLSLSGKFDEAEKMFDDVIPKLSNISGERDGSVLTLGRMKIQHELRVYDSFDEPKKTKLQRIREDLDQVEKLTSERFGDGHQTEKVLLDKIRKDLDSRIAALSNPVRYQDPCCVLL